MSDTPGRGIHGLTRDQQGNTYPEDVADEADICPAGSTYLGGTGFNAVCMSDQRLTLAYLTRNIAGETYPEDEADEASICPLFVKTCPMSTSVWRRVPSDRVAPRPAVVVPL